jgi:hypothetical protein
MLTVGRSGFVVLQDRNTQSVSSFNALRFIVY